MNVSYQQYRDLLLQYLRPQRRRVVALAVLLLSSIGLQLLSPQILRYFIDTAMAGGALRSLIGAAVLFIAVAFLTQALAVGATYVGEQVGWLATNRLRSDLAAHCLYLDMPFHNARTPGELIERIDGDVTALANFFSQFVIQVLGSGLLLVGVLVLLYREDWRVGLALTIFAVVALLALRRTQTIAVPSVTAWRQSSAMLFGFLEERLAGIDDIRANGGGGYAVRRFHEVMRDMFHQARRSEMIGMIIWMTLAGLFMLGYALALGSGAFLFQRGALTIGTVFLIFQYTEMLRRPLEQITDQLKDFQKAAASVGRVQELYQERSQIQDGAGDALPDGPLPVDVDRLTFTYEDGVPVLQDITIHVEPGQAIGLLGRTGSGKTTMMRLLLRLYDPTAGAIMLDGVDIRATPVSELRRRIGVVTQDVQLFQASVRDNLTLFDDHIPDERIMDVLEDLGLGNWVRSLPQGLHTELSPGGAGLSAGEAQLLAFTRVFLRDPGLVILDEASSRLDPATEELIERAVDKLLLNRTAIIIAHRLHTVQRVDDIVILEQGHIREYGPREQLARDPNSRFSQLLQTGLEEVLV